MKAKKNTLTQLNNLKRKNFYFFCMDKNSFALAKILMKHNYRIKGFLEEFALARNEADELIMSARNSVFK